MAGLGCAHKVAAVAQCNQVFDQLQVHDADWNKSKAGPVSRRQGMGQRPKTKKACTVVTMQAGWPSALRLSLSAA
jgi:hypothetical protein